MVIVSGKGSLFWKLTQNHLSSKGTPENGTLVNGKNLLAIHAVMFNLQAQHGKPARKNVIVCTGLYIVLPIRIHLL